MTPFPDRRQAMTRALDGILVVSIEQAVAAPYASSRLADAGARVIQVQRPEGDFARGYDRVAKAQSGSFVWLNRGEIHRAPCRGGEGQSVKISVVAGSLKNKKKTQ